MKITVEISEDYIMETAKNIVANRIADDIFSDYRSGKYCYEHAIKDIVREVIKNDIENLSDRAVQAASVTIANKGVKKMLDKLKSDME